MTWRKARKFCDEKHLPATGGSDSHIPRTVGRAFTIVDAPSKEVSEVLDAIREGSTVPAGKPVRFYERLTKIIR
jgi:predicted metal-dependent phosphoesterase TrpH